MTSSSSVPSPNAPPSRPALPSGVLTANLFENLPDASEAEVIEDLKRDGAVVVERIVTRGQVSPDWYDQAEAEFCAVLAGEASLLFEEGNTTVHLRKGAWVFIPAGKRHKVSWADPEVDTIWIVFKWPPSTTT